MVAPSLLAFIGTPTPIQVRHAIEDGPDGPGWGEPVAMYGQWESTARQITTAEGRVVTVTGPVRLPAGAEPCPGDQVAKGHGPADWREVVRVSSLTWFDGTIMHHEVMVS